MDINFYIRVIRRWSWLLLLAIVVGGGVSYIVVANQQNVYQAQATIAIGGVVRDPNPDRIELLTAQSLTETYVRLARRYTLLEGVVETLNLDLTPESLAGLVEVRGISSTSLLTITVQYTDPVIAADIANELVNQLINQSPSNLTSQQQDQVDLLNGQIDTLTSDVAALRRELQAIDTQILQTEDQQQQVTLNGRRSTLITQINETTNNIANFSATVADITGRTNSIELVDGAREPSGPVGRSITFSTLLGAVVAGLLAGALVLVLETLNETFRTTDELTSFVGLPTLGVIAAFGNKRGGETQRLLTNQEALSPVLDQYHTLRTNLLAMQANNKRKQHIFMVSSATPQEGKSLTTVNLALSMALSGKKVLLIDADLRRPKVHKLLDLDADAAGLTHLLSVPLELDNNEQAATVTEGERALPQTPTDWTQFTQKTHVPGLRVITSGFHPRNPAEILGSPRMRYWTDVFSNDPFVDVVIFDTPPCLAISDSTILANTVAAGVIIVVEAGRTRRALAQKSRQRFEQVNGHIIGLVLNKANLREEAYYGYDYGYGDYYNRPLQPENDPVS
jgi:polysaccharide biosynthesis transport protein